MSITTSMSFAPSRGKTDDDYMRAPDLEAEDAQMKTVSLETECKEVEQSSLLWRFTLTSYDVFAYVVGMLVRIQTIVLGFLLFKVELHNKCVVDYTMIKPIPQEYLPEKLS